MGRRLAATDRTPRLRHPSAPAPVHAVPGDVWGLALELADGDRRRLLVVSADEVLVLNRPR